MTHDHEHEEILTVTIKLPKSVHDVLEDFAKHMEWPIPAVVAEYVFFGLAKDCGCPLIDARLNGAPEAPRPI